MGCGGGGPCDFGVSPSPFGLDFGTLDLGLTIILVDEKYASQRVAVAGHQEVTGG